MHTAFEMDAHLRRGVQAEIALTADFPLVITVLRAMTFSDASNKASVSILMTENGPTLFGGLVG